MNLIVAVDSNWGIGYQDRLLFRISDDMKRFRELTLGKTVILGRKTLQTFPGGRPLEKRTNIVMTRDSSFTAEPALICHSLAELPELLTGTDPADVFVIGGSSLYEQLLPYCRQAFVTQISQTARADCFFPDLGQLPGWKMIDCENHHTIQAHRIDQNTEVSLDFAFCLYQQDQPKVFGHAQD